MQVSLECNVVNPHIIPHNSEKQKYFNTIADSMILNKLFNGRWTDSNRSVFFFPLEECVR